MGANLPDLILNYIEVDIKLMILKNVATGSAENLEMYHRGKQNTVLIISELKRLMIYY